jgi:nucleotide-binding universal stress UspA family protein
MKQFPKIRFVLVRVVVPIGVYMLDEASSKNWKNLAELESSRVCDAEAYLTRVAYRFKSNTSKLDTEVFIGSVAEKLIHYAEENDVDLIIIATHGHSGVSRWMRGSVADRILYASYVPVLIVRAQETKGKI